MKIRVNGRDIVFSQTTIADLINQYRLNPDRIVIEKNGTIVPPTTYETESLCNGDVIEIRERLFISI
jgi:sulfur carrier protein